MENEMATEEGNIAVGKKTEGCRGTTHYTYFR
jgi:hypothetical protein